MDFLINFLGKLYKAQMKLKNPFYNLSEYFFHRKMYERFLVIYNAKVTEQEKENRLIDYAYISLTAFICFIGMTLNSILNILCFPLA